MIPKRRISWSLVSSYFKEQRDHARATVNYLVDGKKTSAAGR
jgi:hypothetical protein